MSSPLRLGIVGCSGHVGYVLGALEALADQVRLVAAAPGGADEDISSVLAPSAYADYVTMLDDAELDLLAVTPHFYRHAEVSLAGLQHDCAVFCEKPLALTLADLDALREAQRSSGRPIGMMLDARYAPTFSTARQLVAEGVIGEVVAGYAQKSYKLGTRPDFYKHRATFGGLIPWVGIHAIDWFSYVSGRRYTTVTARHGNRGADDYPELDNYATCQFALDNGGSAVMSFDYLRPAGAPSHGDDRLRLVGTNGVLEIRDDALQVLTAEGEYRVEVTALPFGLFADFVQAVLNPAHVPLITTQDAFDVTAVALRAREAADSATTLDL